MSNAIVFDIETGAAPEEQLRQLFTPTTWEEWSCTCDSRWKEETKRSKFEEFKPLEFQKFADRAALSAITGRVVAIGVKSEKLSKIIDTSVDEAKALKDWWSLCQQSQAANRRFVGHNIHGFDLPFMVRRSWILGVEPPAWLLERGRYWHPFFVDTMQAWGCGGRDMIGLDALAKACGGAGKLDGAECSGAAFAKMYLSGDPEQRATAEKYLQADLSATWLVAERLGLL